MALPPFRETARLEETWARHDLLRNVADDAAIEVLRLIDLVCDPGYEPTEGDEAMWEGVAKALFNIGNLFAPWTQSIPQFRICTA